MNAKIITVDEKGAISHFVIAGGNPYSIARKLSLSPEVYLVILHCGDDHYAYINGHHKSLDQLFHP